MDHISALKNIGEGKTCLLFGNGTTLRNFDFYEVPKDVIRIGMNITNVSCDYIIYYDREAMKHYEEAPLSPRVQLIGFKHGRVDHTCVACSYYYSYEDMIFGDTGFHALQFADKVFNFKEIFLAGYDYYSEDGSYHYGERKSNPLKMKQFLKHGCGITDDKTPKDWKPVVEKYADIEWKNKIFNCNKRSALKVFPFKNIY